jgi:hypothetical protein
VLVGPLAHRHPVTDGRQLAAARRPVLEPPGRGGVELAALHINAVDVVELDADATGLDVLPGRELRKLASTKIVPAQLFQAHPHSFNHEGTKFSKDTEAFWNEILRAFLIFVSFVVPL